jgi:hypothetical protein
MYRKVEKSINLWDNFELEGRLLKDKSTIKKRNLLDINRDKHRTR